MNPDRLKEARSVAARSTEPFAAWTELKRWSLGKGPDAARAAAVSFMETHGTRPESAAILPEIARLAQQMPGPQRNELLHIAHGSFSMAAGFISRLVPQPNASAARFGKKDAKQLPVTPDIARMMEQRDALFHVNRGALALPQPPREARRAGRAGPAEPEAPRLTREDFEHVLMSDGHGHALVRSLAERLSRHGHERYPAMESYGLPMYAKKRPAVKAKSAKRPAARKRARPAGKKSLAARKSRAPVRSSPVRAAKKPARKAAARKKKSRRK